MKSTLMTKTFKLKFPWEDKSVGDRLQKWGEKQSEKIQDLKTDLITYRNGYYKDYNKLVKGELDQFTPLDVKNDKSNDVIL
jgi:hypothetical protein